MAGIVHNQDQNPFSCNSNLICVPVIATFNSAGEIRPLYFSLEGLRLKIDNIKFVDRSRSEVIVFRCEVTFSDRVQQITLHYHKRDAIWTMKRL